MPGPAPTSQPSEQCDAGYEEARRFRGFELWNEFRAGYTLDLPVGRLPTFVNLQYLYGFGLFPGNKPAGFGEQEKTFHAPVFFLGVRF